MNKLTSYSSFENLKGEKSTTHKPKKALSQSTEELKNFINLLRNSNSNKQDSTQPQVSKSNGQ